MGRTVAIAGTLCAAAAVVGCSNLRSATPPLPGPAPPFSGAGTLTQPPAWWRAFEEPALDAQVGRAFAGNHPLAAGLQRVFAAQAVARREASDLFPDLDGLVGAGADLRTNLPDNGDFTLAYAMTYPVDLWGEIEARVQARELAASATWEDYQAVALTLAADVAGAWFSLVEAKAQLVLLEEQIETNEQGLELQEARFGLGQVQLADVLRQRQLLESTREQTFVVKSRVATLEHLLAVLQGVPPQEATYAPGDELPSLPPLPAAGVPCELLQRRPDVRRDFLLLQSADRDFASAVSAQYPRLNLTGSLTTAATDGTSLFKDTFVSLGGQLIAPVFDGGQRRAEVDRTEAVTRQRFHEYVQTSLVAFRQVEDALARERFLLERIERLDNQVKLARESAERLREQYLLTDTTDFLAVLSATTDSQRLQRTTLSVRLDLILNRIGLYLALAGGVDVGSVAAGTALPVAAAEEPDTPPEPEPPESLTPLPLIITDEDVDPEGEADAPAPLTDPEEADDAVIRETPLGIPPLDDADTNLKDLSSDDADGGPGDE